MRDIEIQSTSSHVSGDEYVEEGRFLEFLKFANTLLLLHVRVQVYHLHPEGLYEVLDPLAGLDCVGEDYGLGTSRKILQVADEEGHTLVVAVSEGNSLDQFFRQEEEGT